jgi:hypothetical protein
MPSWLLKTALQHAIYWLPQSHRVNEWFQNRRPGSLDLPREKFLQKIAEGRKYLTAYSKGTGGGGMENITALELGTGWFPIIPAAHFLAGVGKTWAFDIAPLPNTQRVQRMAELFLATSESGELQTVLPELKPERLPALRELLRRLPAEPVESALQAVGVFFQVRDGRDTGVADHSVDLIYSSGVLHHIPLPVLRGLFTEFLRVGRPGGVTSHRLHLADQFSYFDRRITPFNSLRYTARQWRWLDSPLTPQNRLRLPDYRALYREFDLDVFDEENQLGAPGQLDQVPLAPEFRHYDRHDLLVLNSLLSAHLPAA